MRKTVCLTLAGMLLAAMASAQGMGGGPGGERPHSRRGGSGGDMPGAPSPDLRPAAAIIPVDRRLKGLITIAGETRLLKAVPVTTDAADMSAVYAQRGAQVTLDGVDITTSGAATLVDNTRQYGMNSALLIDSAASVTVTGGRIATSGQGATAIHVSGPDSGLDISGATLTTAGSGAYGVEVRAGAHFSATDLSVATQSDHAVAVSLPRGQPMRLNGGRFTTAGPLSPAFLLGGSLDATNLTAEARRAEAVVITGGQPVSFTDSRLSGDYGVLIYRPDEANGLAGAPPMGGRPDGRPDGARPEGRMGGSPPARPSAPRSEAGMRPVTDMLAGPAPVDGGLRLYGGSVNGRRAVFSVSNMRTLIALDGVTVTGPIILRAVADQWGELGRNGGDATLDARNQTLTGDFVTDAISHIAVNLTENSHLTGKATRNTDITLDSTSTWTLTDDSSVGKLTGDLSRIDSQGYILSYDKIRNPAFNGQTLDLPGGGKLLPGL